MHPAGRKRYCRHCGERIRRTTRRCPHCFKRALPWRDYLAAAVVVIIVALLVLKYSGVI